MRAVAFIAALLFAAGPIQGQSVPLQLEWLSVQDGLPGTGILDIEQDPEGYLWFATWFGIVRYDGRDFEYFTPDPFDPDALPRSRILGLHGTEDRLWVAAGRAGLFFFDYASAQFSRYPVPTESDADVQGVFVDSSGTLWVGTWSSGLYRRRIDGEWTHFQYEPDSASSLSSNHARVVLEDTAGQLWVSSGNGINLYDSSIDGFRQLLVDDSEPRTPDFSPTDFDGYPTAATMSLVETPDETYWLGTGRGLVHMDASGKIDQRYSVSEGLPAEWVHTLFEIDDRTLFVGTLGGPVVLDIPSGQISPVDLGEHPGRRYLDRFVISTFLDHSKVLWLGTTGALAKVKLGSDRFTPLAYPVARGIGIVEDDWGRVWVGGDDGTLGVIENGIGRQVSFAGSDLVRGMTLSDLFIDSSNRLIIGSMGGGLLKLRLPPPGGSSLTLVDRFDSQNGLSGDEVSRVFEDADGSLWVANSSALDRIDPSGLVTSVSHDPSDSTSLPVDLIRDVARASDGALWVTSTHGPARSLDDGATFQRFPHVPGDPSSPSHDWSYRLAAGVNGTMWVTTYGGLDHFRPDTGGFDHYVLDTELPLGSTTCVQVGEIVWASTFAGVGRLDPDTGDAVHYGIERGLRAVDFANGANCHLGPTGRLYFTGIDRLYVANTVGFRDNRSAPRVALAGISVGAETFRPATWPGERAALPRDRSDLTFDFVGLHYEDPARLTYAYRLLESGSEWVDLGSVHSVRLRLDPGEHTFQVRATSSVGVSSEPVSTSFVIAPAWWQSVWFWVLAGLLVSGLLVAGYGLRLRHLSRRADLLRRVVRERTIELRSEKDRTASQANRLIELDRAKSHFFANVSHEFRTPLTLILGPLQDLMEGRSSAVQLAGVAPLMRRSALRLLRLINQILDLSKLEAGSMAVRESPTELVSFVRGIVMTFASHAEREHLTLLFEASEPQCPTLTDKDKLEKVLTNLVSNALSFTPAGGKVHVALELLSEPPRCEIHVSDTGPGIPPDRLPHVFERFYHVDASARRASEGAGIGLSLAREMTELMGGTLDVVSRKGFGTEFLVVLPRKEVPVSDRSRISPRTEHLTEEPFGPSIGELHAVTNGSQPSDRPLVLVVEDNDDMRDYLVQSLSERYRTVSAGDGEDGLRVAHQTEPDLVLSDVMMPKLDGFGLCRAMKGDPGLESTPIILLTARADRESRIEGLTCEADDYLAKPFNTSELIARIENLIHSRERMKEIFRQEILLRPDDISVTSSEAAFLEDVLEVVGQHLGDSTFSVDWLADELGVSRRQLERRLNDIAGRSPADLIRQMRIQRATQLLQAHAGTVAEVGYMVGFRSSSHFARVYQDMTGRKPSDDKLISAADDVSESVFGDV